MKTIFKQIISDFHSSPLKEAQPRTLQIPLKTQKIISLIGPRRAGKSFLLFNLMHQLLQSGTLMTDIVYINFEDERILLQGNELQVILDAYFELYPDKDIHQLYFFFDEIHNITGREKFIRRIYDQGMTHIFISGSNAKLLSKEIATSLRGRSLTYELLPLSFKEFLNFKGIQPNLYSTKGKAQLLHLQQTYLLWGGFPEIIDFTDDLKIKTLQEYFDVMLYNDIIERYKIKDTTLLKQFIKLLIQSTTKEYSVNKLGNQFKSKGFKFDKNVLYDFVEYLDTIYFGKSVSKYEYALSKQTLKKIYLFDNGYLNTLSFSFSENFGKLLENAVFGELYRRYGEEMYFLKNGVETDFVLPHKENLVMQVCYDVHSQDYEREIDGCFQAMEKFALKESYLITAEQEQEIKKDGKTIYVLPFYQRCLQ